LIVEGGAVAGVRYRGVDLHGSFLRKHRQLRMAADKLGTWWPPVGARLNARAEALWEASAVEAEARGATLIISAGGFVYNAEMRAKYEGAWKGINPLGTVGDDGSSIRLGSMAGGTTDYLERFTAWRFMGPPAGLLEGVSVGPSGARIANEDLYGATHAAIMITEHEGRGVLVLDSRQWKAARAQVPTQTQALQRITAAWLFATGHDKADTIEALASKIGIPPAGLRASVDAYNSGIASEAGDPAHKAPEMCSPIEQGPFYAIDISIKNGMLNPATGLTLGGLRVEEQTGELLDLDGRPIPNIYAAGRAAVGICSNSYISGLSLADAVFSGRRAGTHAAVMRPGSGLRALTPI
jgi:3-oxo-5alpha-steroid 4-dehydrogenase